MRESGWVRLYSIEADNHRKIIEKKYTNLEQSQRMRESVRVINKKPFPGAVPGELPYAATTLRCPRL